MVILLKNEKKNSIVILQIIAELMCESTTAPLEEDEDSHACIESQQYPIKTFIFAGVLRKHLGNLAAYFDSYIQNREIK